MLLAGVLLLGACATQQPVSTVVPPLLHHGTIEQVPDIDVLKVTPAMEDFLERYILSYTNSQTRLHLLTTSVTSAGVLGFEYSEGSTMTAAEAFDSRSGNCIGFANMMIALARRSGLQAHYQEVFRRPQWISRSNTVLLIKHVNVVVESSRYTYVMDISGINISPNARRRIVMDDYAKALYLNNLGAEALLKNDLSTAYAYMKKAIDTDPRMTDSWINLGVVFGRNDQLDSAQLVLERALQIDSTQYSAMSNLYEVYLERGNLEAAQNLQAKVERYRRANPYYLLYLSDEALALEQFDESIDLLTRAIKKRDDDHILYFALAKTQFLSGETIAARNSLGRAREFAPENLLAHYNRPLDELVAEAVAEAQARAAEEAAEEALKSSVIQ
jgi:tetratricopeptide (TPR) repeat protein